MCGIFGFVGRRSRAETIDLDIALKSLHHRGPDDRGTYFGVAKTDRDLACAFAHTRLAIIDLSPAGHQPMTTDDGRYTIVYNGEVYNFRDIRQELEQFGHRFRSNCDTEVVLKSYAQWGSDCVSRLRGMFAFAIWDEERGSLFMARDRLGVKPLYYTQTPSGFAFASEVRVLMKCDLADRRISHEGLTSYLAFGSAYEPFTIVDGVMALPPGSQCTIDGRGAHSEIYWNTDEGRTQKAPEDLSQLIESAVSSELEADVPIGIFLSGGIDSTAVLSIAAARAKTPVHTFTMTFDEKRYNEETFASQVAATYGSNHSQVHLSADSALSELDNVFNGLDQPSADGVNTYFVAKAARSSGLTVALSGVGGDEVFAGYGNFRSFRSMLAVSRLAAPVKRVLPRPGSSIPFSKNSTRRKKAFAVLRAAGDATRTYAALRSMFDDAQVSFLQHPAARNGSTGFGALTVPNDATDKINFLSKLELTNYVRNTLLRDTDAMSMAHSLEVRVPFLDHLLLETVLGIPGRRKLASSVNKPLLVAAIPSLPRNIATRRKMGFLLPLEEWLRGAFKNRVAGLLNAGVPGSDGILNADATRAVWRSFARGERYMNYSRVWCLTALLAWAEVNRVGN